MTPEEKRKSKKRSVLAAPAGREASGLRAASAPLLERTATIRFIKLLVRTKAPLKRAQSRRFANFHDTISI
jgi:hypothetical protein